MNVKKAIKRIAAIGTGAAMLGATILGAVAAADLSQYPSPLFIGTDGKFNAVLVVGKAAASEDIIGAIDIATALQAASVTTTTTGATTTVLEGGAKVETSGQKLYFGDSMNTTKVSLTSTELATFLKDGKITDEDGTEFTYKQIIT
ncbi:S-layer protein [Candidatus Woesearchaeota archaeon]|nr:S-layer protein [Candidatus Woesearchaeota archaeon]